MIHLLNLFLVATAPMLGALLLSRFVFGRNPAARHAVLVAGLAGVWLTPLTLMATNFSPWHGVPLPSRIEPFVIVDQQLPALPEIETHQLEKAIAAPVVQKSISLPKVETVMLTAWLAGTTLLLIRLFISAIRAITLCRSAKRLNFRGESRVFISSKVCEPLCVGLIHPIVILPDDLPNRLTSDELRAVVVHESAHASRQDHLIALSQRLTAALLWPHPLVHLLGRDLAKAREESCDNHALRFMPPTEYARLLVRLCESIATKNSGANWPVAAMSGSRFPIAKRIAGLLDPRRNIMTSAPRKYLVVAIALLGAITAICATARFTYAQGSQQPLTPREEIGKKIIDQFVQDLSTALANMNDELFKKSIEPLLADDFTIQGYGGLATKDQFIALINWKNPDEVHGPGTISDQQLRFFGDAAIWTAKLSEDEHVHGMPVHKNTFITMVWSDRNSKWQVVHLQALPEETHIAFDPRANLTPTPAPNPPLSNDPAAYPQTVKFELGKSEFQTGDEIVITEVLGTNTLIEGRQRYMVRGRYTLKSHDKATLAAYVSSHSEPLGYTDPLQQTTITQGSGTFQMAFQMLPDGFPHLAIYSQNPGEHGFGEVYFGTGDSVLRR
jgi:beta-lactamase regulating signal transducer with metallopeptidase domain